MKQPSSLIVKVTILALLVLAAYAPTLTLPFISDDFHQIPLAFQCGSAGWVPLWHSPELRTRATFMVVAFWLDRLFGFVPAPFYAATIFLHFLCTLLVYATGVFAVVNWRTSFWAACFFAVYEGHQEAVMWISASMELLLFLFGVGAILLWYSWLQSGSRSKYILSLISFALAMASKESIWIFPALMILLVLFSGFALKRAILSLLPFVLVSAAFIYWVATTAAGNGRFTDGSFSLHSSWLLVDMNSFWHILIIWGLLAFAAIASYRERASVNLAALSCLWIAASLVPYSFLTYMPRVPSRQTYLASLGLSWLVASAYRVVSARLPRAQVLIAAAVLIVNCEILWVKKVSQFRERAEPSDLLRAAAAEASGPIHIECIPLSRLVAASELTDYHAQAVFDKSAESDDPHCFSIWYKNAAGTRVNVRKKVGITAHGLFR